MVLAAGRGTRLGKLTRESPKGMLHAAGRPILEWIVRHLVSQGFDRIAMNLHYRPEAIRDHFGDGSAFDVGELRFFAEPELFGTAGGIRHAAGFLAADGAFLVQYGDVVTDQDLAQLVDGHRERSVLATLLIHHRPGSNSVIALDDEGCVTRFLERPTPEERSGIRSSWAFSGICVLEPEVLELIPEDRPSDLPRDVFTPLAAESAVHAQRLDGYRIAVDSPARLGQLRHAIAEGQCQISG